MIYDNSYIFSDFMLQAHITISIETRRAKCVAM